MLSPFRLLLLCLALCPFATAADDSANSRYQEMQSAFERGDFANARTLGEKLLTQGNLSPQLFQFLGNTHYRLGELGAAALYYRRAALFPPAVPEVRQNIAHIRDRTGNLTFKRNEFREQYAGFLGRTMWFGIAITAGWIAVISFGITIFLPRSSSFRGFLTFVRVLAVIAAVLSLVGWYWRPTYEKIEKLAIVTVPDTKAFTSATITAGMVSALPPGSEIRRLEDRGPWSYVEIPGEDQNRRGWVLNSTFEPLWPYQRGYLE